MMVGMIFLGQLLIPSIELMVIRVITSSWLNKGDTGVGNIVLKNLQAHKNRNDKTALMMMIAVMFLIASGSGFA
jgi:hypothetical protein